jgi:hypothetical protein
MQVMGVSHVSRHDIRRLAGNECRNIYYLATDALGHSEKFLQRFASTACCRSRRATWILCAHLNANRPVEHCERKLHHALTLGGIGPEPI